MKMLKISSYRVDSWEVLITLKMSMGEYLRVVENRGQLIPMKAARDILGISRTYLFHLREQRKLETLVIGKSVMFYARQIFELRKERLNE